ncbi:MAG: hypothetical protein ACRCZ0_11215 [Cetobacterium sp.]
MADMNVMTLIKKKGPKKLRGPAGAAAKKRLDNAQKFNVPAKQLKIFRNKSFLLSFSDNEMYENIVTFISTLSPLSDRRLIKMFNILRNGIPWPLVKPFFKEFDETSSKNKQPNIILFFENYIKRPEIEEQITEMKEVIFSRQIDPLPYQKITKSPEKSESGNQRQRVALLFETDPKAIRKPMFGPGDIPSKCEQEYRRAPWMYKFINEPIRGFALKNESPQYTTNQLVYTKEDRQPWYRANQKWYREVCEKGRVFNDGNVAYVTATGDVIVESREMYETSKKDWEHIIDIEFSPVNEQSFDVAKTLLKENPILSNYKSEDIDAILASISGSVNYDMAKNLSWILVFLSKLTKESQIYHYRVQNHQYKPEDLILLDRYTLLPEIYKNAKANSDEIEYLLKSRRRFIENQFYSRLQPIEIGKRKRTSPSRPEIFRYLTTDAFSKCPQNLKDIIYYEEDGELYCFNRKELKTINPITGKKLSLEFLDELARIKSTPNSSNVSKERVLPIIRERQPEQELAPGLFQKLKEIIAFSNYSDIILQCSFCKTNLTNPKYKSVKDRKKVQFCGPECFNQFQFSKK